MHILSTIACFAIQSIFMIGVYTSSNDYTKDARGINIEDTVCVGDDIYHVDWLFKDNFESSDWSKNWILEGSGTKVKVKDGRLFIMDYGVGTTLWHKGEFSKRLIVRYIVRSEDGKKDDKLNFNHISHARNLEGGILQIGTITGRIGAYAEYHRFPNYIATLTFKHSRIRKNPGFNMLSDSATYASKRKSYRVVYTVDDDRIRYYLNDNKVHDIENSEVLEGGKFGIRTWNTFGSWDNIEIGVIKAVSTLRN